MTNYITKEGLAELKNELKQIQNVDLVATIESINKALAEGDLKENSALDSAKTERDGLVAREREIMNVLADYELIVAHTGPASKTVSIGGEVKLMYLENNATFTMKIVGSSESDAVGGKISNESPLAMSILGKKEGDEGSFKLKDKVIKVKIVEIIA
jgi:transcription elongation factor GreA